MTRLGACSPSWPSRGLLDHTIVIITSDHGEQFGEHGKLFHMNSLYRVLLEVPLLIRFPPSRAGQPVNSSRQ